MAIRSVRSCAVTALRTADTWRKSRLIGFGNPILVSRMKRHRSIELRSKWLALLSLLISINCWSQTTAASLGGCGDALPERILEANPGNYLSMIANLMPGDLLNLSAGDYVDGLNLHDLAGEPNRCITISGPQSGPPAVFIGRDCCNTISLSNASYLVIQHFEIDGDSRLGDAIKAESTSSSCHHITLQNLSITIKTSINKW